LEVRRVAVSETAPTIASRRSVRASGERHAASLDLRQVEDAVDQIQEMAAVPQDRVEKLPAAAR